MIEINEKEKIKRLKRMIELLREMQDEKLKRISKCKEDTLSRGYFSGCYDTLKMITEELEIIIK